MTDASPSLQNPAGQPGLPWIESQDEQAQALANWQVTASADEILYAQALGADEVQYANDNSKQYVNEADQIDLDDQEASDMQADEAESLGEALTGDEVTFEDGANDAYDGYQLGVAEAIHDYRISANQDEQDFLSGRLDDGTNEFYQAMKDAVSGATAGLRDLYNTQMDAAAELQAGDDAAAEQETTDQIDDEALSIKDEIDVAIDGYDNSESTDYDRQQRDDALALYNLTVASAAGPAGAMAAVAEQDASPWNTLAAEQSAADSAQVSAAALASLTLAQSQADLTESEEEAQHDAPRVWTKRKLKPTTTRARLWRRLRTRRIPPRYRRLASKRPTRWFRATTGRRRRFRRTFGSATKRITRCHRRDRRSGARS